MKKHIQNFNYVLLLVLGLINFAWSQEYSDYDDYVYEEDYSDTDEYDSFFDDDEYDIDYYESTNVGDLVYNPVTGRMQRSYYYLGRTLYILDMQTGGYYPITNQFRRSIGYPDQFFFDSFWLGRRNISINFNFGRNYYNPRYTYYDSWRRGNRYRNYNNFGWGIGFGGFNGFSIFFNNPYRPYSRYASYYNPYRPYRGWGWYGPGGWNARENNRTNLVNVGNFNPNRNIRLNSPIENQGRTRTTNRRESPRSQNIVNARSKNPLQLADRTTRGNSSKDARIPQRSTRSIDVVQSRRQNRADIPMRGETVRMDRSSVSRSQSRYTRSNSDRNQSSGRERRRTDRDYQMSERSSRSSQRSSGSSQRNNSPSYDRGERGDRSSRSSSRQKVESRSRNQVKTQQRSKQRTHFESRNRSSSQSSGKKRSNRGGSKYSSKNNKKSFSGSKRSTPNKSKKAKNRF